MAGVGVARRYVSPESSYYEDIRGGPTTKNYDESVSDSVNEKCTGKQSKIFFIKRITFFSLSPQDNNGGSTAIAKCQFLWKYSLIKKKKMKKYEVNFFKKVLLAKNGPKIFCRVWYSWKIILRLILKSREVKKTGKKNSKEYEKHFNFFVILVIPSVDATTFSKSVKKKNVCDIFYFIKKFCFIFMGIYAPLSKNWPMFKF